jgi:glc operon protein GlcG
MKLKRIAVGLLGLGLLMHTGLHAQVLTYGAPISLQDAKSIATVALGEARKNKLTVAVAIVDSSGSLTYFEKLDGTQIASVDVAIGKARTANNFKRATKVFEDALANGRQSLLSLPDAILGEGGLPIIRDGKIVGAIGVSGATSQLDGVVAAAGLNAPQP